MVNYRALAHGFQKKAALNFETSLSSISVIIKAAAHHLTRDEISVIRSSIPLELKQLVQEGRGHSHRQSSRSEQGRGIVEMVSLSLNLTDVEARRRVLILLAELRAATSPWDNTLYIEILDGLFSAIRAEQPEALTAEQVA